MTVRGRPGLASGTEASLGTGHVSTLRGEGPRPHLSLKGLALRLLKLCFKGTWCASSRIPL